MPIAPIPMPLGPLESFSKGFHMTDSLMDQILGRNQLKQKTEHEKEALEQARKNHLENLAISQQTQSRLSQMMPYQIQALRDAHAKASPDWDINQAKKLYELAMNPQYGGNQGTNNFGKTAPENNELRDKLMSMGMFGQELPQGQGAMPMESQQEVPQYPVEENAPNNAPQNTSNSMPNLMPNSNPNSNPNLMQMVVGGLLKKKSGYNPFAPVPETPDQKHAGAINQAVSIDEAKATRKKLDEIEKTAQALLPYLGKVNTIGDILKRKPDLAGRTTQLADILGMTRDEDVGTFLSAAQALQAHMAKEMSSRGGYGVSKLVEQAKPNIGKSTQYNKGVIKDLKQSMKESFEQMKSEYERLSNGKKFPYNFEQYFKEVTGSETQGKMVPMISPNGKRVMIPSDKVDAALAAGGKHA